MELHEIKQQTCPDCGAPAQSESKRDKHCNGHWNEERVFSCGASIRFSPNYMAESGNRPCPKARREVDKKRKRFAARKKIDLEILNLNCDKIYKDRLTDAIRHLDY